MGGEGAAVMARSQGLSTLSFGVDYGVGTLEDVDPHVDAGGVGSRTVLSETPQRAGFCRSLLPWLRDSMSSVSLFISDGVSTARSPLALSKVEMTL